MNYLQGQICRIFVQTVEVVMLGEMIKNMNGGGGGGGGERNL